MRLNFPVKIILIVAIPLTFEIVFAVGLGVLFAHIGEQQKTVQHYMNTASLIQELRNDIFDAYRNLYEYGSLQDEKHVREIQRRLDLSKSRGAKLHSLFKNDPTQLKRYNTMYESAMKIYDYLFLGISQLSKNREYDFAMRSMREVGLDSLTVDEFRNSVRELMHVERLKSKECQRLVEETTNHLITWFFVGLVVNIWLAITCGALLGRSIVTRVNSLISNINCYLSGKPLAPELAGDDEITLLDKRFREMIATIDAAATREATILNNVHDVLLSLDRSGTITHLNPACKAMWGYEEAELLNERISKILAPDAEKDYLNLLNDLADSTSPRSLESSIVRKDGKIIDVVWNITWSSADESLVAACHDISARRELERMFEQSVDRLYKIIESLPVGIVQIDNSGTVMFLNSTACRLLQVNVSGFPGRKLDSFLQKKYDSSKVDETDSSELELRRRNSENLQVLSASFSQLPFEVAPGRLVTLNDITVRIQLEEQRAEFIAMISHDLKSPLAAISSFLQMVGEGNYDSDLRKLKIRANATYNTAFELIETLQNLLDLEKLEQGMVNLQEEVLDSTAMLEKIETLMSSRFTESGIKWEIRNSSFRFKGDELCVMRVLNNLVSNAVKHTPAGGTVTIGCEPRDGNGYFFIDNDGASIPIEEQDLIFEKYRQVGRTTFRGSGLGLSICRHLLSLMNGQVGLDRERKDGTRFWFTLPLES